MEVRATLPCERGISGVCHYHIHRFSLSSSSSSHLDLLFLEDSHRAASATAARKMRSQVWWPSRALTKHVLMRVCKQVRVVVVVFGSGEDGGA